MEDRFSAAGFALGFQGSTPPEDGEPSYGYMPVRKTDSRTGSGSPAAEPACPYGRFDTGVRGMLNQPRR
jgi:hypothetical protein